MLSILAIVNRLFARNVQIRMHGRGATSLPECGHGVVNHYLSAVVAGPLGGILMLVSYAKLHLDTTYAKLH